MRNTVYYKWFKDSLRPDQVKDYDQMSLNQQKDWYISYLEDHFGERTEREKETSIGTFNITTGMGKMMGEKLPFLTISQQNDFDSIGYSGKLLNGTVMSRQEFLNSLNIGTFKVEQTKFDDGSFEEKFLIIKVK